MNALGLSEGVLVKGAVLAAGMAMFLTGCDAFSSSVYTLYRSSLIDPNLRVHVATFDASGREEYNRENCAIAAKLFGDQPGVRTKFWCEKGRFKD